MENAGKHMSSIVKPYLLRASLFAGLAILLGLALSFAVYYSSAAVRDNANDLMNNRLPVLTSVNQYIADLSEQERIIYEYYANVDTKMFWQAFNENKKMLVEHQMLLFSALNENQALAQVRKNEMTNLTTQQKNFDGLVVQYDQAMRVQGDNWDDIRALLFKISQTRRDMLPSLHRIEAYTQQLVNDGHKESIKQMSTTHNMVLFYGISIVLIAGVVSWYIRQYVLTTAKNTRLALFPHLNPNPILSVNNIGELEFSNPATEVLLKKIGLAYDDISYLMPSNFLAIRKEIASNPNHSVVIEQKINGYILQINMNWLQEIDAYDIHILDITERKLAEEKVKHLAFYVQETQLPNQYKLNNDLDSCLAPNDKKQHQFAFGLMELLQFNHLVTAYGVATTKELVCALTKTISQALPAGVSFYQINDYQFALLTQNHNAKNLLEQLTSLIIHAVRKPIKTAKGELIIELDFGFCLAPAHGNCRDELYKNVYTALASAKESEHQHFSLYEEAFGQEIVNNATMVEKLRNALALNELFLVFQPQLDLKSQKVTGIETLVRWRHQNNIVSPADFIPLAEQSGLIIPIGYWILEQACIFAKQLVDAGHEDIVVAVNVSPRQFSHPDFCQSVIDILANTHLLAKNLELEITEGVFINNETKTLAVMKQLKSLGIQLSIDDFGTGYSSLSYLKRFPVDKLKIDQSFIRDCHNNEEDKALVKTIISLGKNLGLSLIAEGVEELEHVEFLQSLACDEIQGYWFSRPIEADELVAFLKR